MTNLDWDHLRIFLAVMRAPSLRQAAHRMGVSHPTVRRQVEALEQCLDLRLFDRQTSGLHATPAAMELLPMAEEVEASIQKLGLRAIDLDPELRGRVRLTAPRLLITEVLMPDIVAFSDRHPQIELQIDLNDNLVQLGPDADVGIRIMRHGASPKEGLVGRRAGHVWSAIYGKPHQWVGWSGDPRDREWTSKTPFPDLPIRGRFPSQRLQLEAARAGMGLALLPCIMAEGALPRLTEPECRFDILGSHASRPSAQSSTPRGAGLPRRCAAPKGGGATRRVKRRAVRR